MPEEHTAGQAERRRRVKRLKKIIVLALTVLILTPTALCVFLFARVNSLENQMRLITGELEELVRLSGELQEQLKAETAVTAQSGGDEGQEAKAQPQGTGNAGVLEDTGSGRRNERPADLTQEQGTVSGNSAMAVSSDSVEEQARHKVYLTFDDGPSMYTEDILDILDRYDVKATFFVLGREDEKSKERLKDIVNRGHTLGMHSYSHKYSEVYRSVEDFAEDFNRLRDFLYDATGVLSKCYRFPGGSSNTVSKVDMQEFIQFLENNDTRFYDWNASSGDGGSKLLDVQTLTANSLAGIETRDSTIILFHDSADKRTTVEALPIIIENILAMEDTEILPITEDTELIQHIHKEVNKGMEE